ncbi:hypothetical protein ACMGE7_11695 [Macrococcus equi]|uniref:hypothetical protein n=1 Tax=Macrococcus equi TaxID=3395462 RepID=UPI0039BEB8EC
MEGVQIKEFKRRYWTKDRTTQDFYDRVNKFLKKHSIYDIKVIESDSYVDDYSENTPTILVLYKD